MNTDHTFDAASYTNHVIQQYPTPKRQFNAMFLCLLILTQPLSLLFLLFCLAVLVIGVVELMNSITLRSILAIASSTWLICLILYAVYRWIYILRHGYIINARIIESKRGYDDPKRSQKPVSRRFEGTWIVEHNGMVVRERFSITSSNRRFLKPGELVPVLARVDRTLDVLQYIDSDVI